MNDNAEKKIENLVFLAPNNVERWRSDVGYESASLIVEPTVMFFLNKCKKLLHVAFPFVIQMNFFKMVVNIFGFSLVAVLFILFCSRPGGHFRFGGGELIDLFPVTATPPPPPPHSSVS